MSFYDCLAQSVITEWLSNLESLYETLEQMVTQDNEFELNPQV